MDNAPTVAANADTEISIAVSVVILTLAVIVIYFMVKAAKKLQDGANAVGDGIRYAGQNTAHFFTGERTDENQAAAEMGGAAANGAFDYLNQSLGTNYTPVNPNNIGTNDGSGMLANPLNAPNPFNPANWDFSTMFQTY